MRRGSVQEVASRVDLTAVVEESIETDHVAAPVAGGEVGPSAGSQIHLEGAEAAVGAAWVSATRSRPLAPAVRQQAPEEVRKTGERRAVYHIEVDALTL